MRLAQPEHVTCPVFAFLDYGTELLCEELNLHDEYRTRF